MSVAESLLLAVALCADTLAVSTAGGLKYRMPRPRWLLFAFVLGGFQGLFPLMGALTGAVCEQFIEAVDHWIAFGLLLLVGSKMIVDALRTKRPVDNAVDDCGDSTALHYDDQGHDNQTPTLKITTMCLLGVATSIDAFAVGIGFGLDSSVAECFITCATIAAVTFTVALTGIGLGRAGRIVPERWTGIIAGLVLIGIGTKILVEHLAAS